jgi:hypothetical protein
MFNENLYGPSPAVVKARSVNLGGHFSFGGPEAAALSHKIATFEGVAPG